MFIYRVFNRAYRDYVHDAEILHALNIIVLSVVISTFFFTAQFGIALTGYASLLGAGEFAFGVISSLPVFAGLLQIPVSYFAQKSGKYKQLLIGGGIIQRSSWIIIAFIPYIFPVEQSRVWALIVLVTLGAMGGSFFAITHMTLMASVMPKDITGRFITTRQKVGNVVGLATGVCIAFLLDFIPGFLGYTFVFVIAGTTGLADILLYTGIKFSSIPKTEEGFSFAEGIKNCFTSSITRNFLFFWAFWFFVVNLTAPYFGLYAIDVLGLSFVNITIFGTIVAQTITFFIVSRWGVFLDRYGSKLMLLISTTIASLTISAWLFATPGNVIPLIVFNVFGGFFWCAVDACFVNMHITHTPTKQRPTTLAILAVSNAVAAAIALLTGGAFLETFSPIMYRLNLTFFGTPFDHFKLLFSIGILLRFIGISFLLPKLWNEKDMSVRESYAMAYDEFVYRVRYELSRLRIRR